MTSERLILLFTATTVILVEETVTIYTTYLHYEEFANGD